MRRLFFSLLAGTGAGILFASVIFLTDYTLVWWLVGVGGFLFIYSWQAESPRVVLLVAILVLGLSVGQARFIDYHQNLFDPRLDEQIGQDISLVSQVVNFPEDRRNSQRVIVSPVGSQVKVLAFIPLHESVTYGDRVVLQGQLTYPENFITDLGKEFDYVNYLKAKGIAYEISFPEVIEIAPASGNPVLSLLYQVRTYFVSQLERRLPEPHSSLAGGILLGVESSLGDALEDSFRRTGIIHIVVLSGYNVAIIADTLMKMLAFLPVYVSLSVGAGGVILFALLVGGGPTVIRASLMYLLALWARATGRIYDVSVALLVAGAVMVFFNPMVLVYDVGFQLSFLATLGLIYVAPVIEPYLKRLPNRLALRELVVATVSTQIAVLPWILFKIGQLSLVALPVNLLVLPVIPLAMLFSFLSGLMGDVFGGLLFSWISFGLLDYTLRVVWLFDQLPVAAVEVGAWPAGLVVMAYLVIIVWIVRHQVGLSRSD